MGPCRDAESPQADDGDREGSKDICNTSDDVLLDGCEELLSLDGGLRPGRIGAVGPDRRPRPRGLWPRRFDIADKCDGPVE